MQMTLYRHPTHHLHPTRINFAKIRAVRFYRENTRIVVLAGLLAAECIGVALLHTAANATTAFQPQLAWQEERTSVPVPQNIDPKLLGSADMKVVMKYIPQTGHSKLIGAPYGALIGLRGQGKPISIPDSATVNWGKNLQRMWASKLRRENVSPATRKWASHVVEGYTSQKRDTKSVHAFVEEIDGQVKSAHRAINYGALCSHLHIQQCSALYATMGRIRGKNIAAYGMTEIFPSHSGDFNYAMLDTLLRNAGENYIHAIPSGGDNLLSTGYYQFTSLAIRRDKSGNLGGVSFVDNFAGQRLAGSVVRLKISQVHKAAFTFAVYNMALMMRNMNAKDANTLAHKCSVSQITEVIATSHHQPARAWGSARNWIHAGCVRPYQAYLNSHLKEYALKTSVNLKAIESHAH